MTLSARNHPKGTIEEIQHGGVLSHVTNVTIKGRGRRDRVGHHETQRRRDGRATITLLKVQVHGCQPRRVAADNDAHPPFSNSRRKNDFRDGVLAG